MRIHSLDLKDTGTVEYFKRLGLALKEDPSIVETFSTHQINSKMKLLELISDIEYNDIGILACWVPTIIGLAFAGKHVTGYDISKESVKASKFLFPEFTFYGKDIMTMNPSNVKNHNLIINTSCEHMQPMNCWRGWDAIKTGTYFAFQTNNMFHIEDHINCVESIDDFINQMPQYVNIIRTDELQIKEYTRFTIIGHA